MIPDNITKEYELLCKSLNQMQEEYRFMPSKLLEKKIKLVYDRLIQIDRSIPKRS